MSDKQTKNSFSIRVETLAKKDNILLITSLANLCSEYGIDESKITTFINRGLKEKIQIEAEDMLTITKAPGDRPSLFIE